MIGIGTRYSDFTTASKTAFQNPDVRFININVAEFDADKHHALPLVGDARATLDELAELLAGYHVAAAYRATAERLHAEWDAEVERIYAIRNTPLPSQGELIGAVNELGDPDGDHGLRGRQPARRPAQAVAHAPPQELPPGVRLLAAWATRSPAGWASRWPRPSARST